MDRSNKKRLIVNADDFGMAPNVTDGILAAHREGIVTSTSMMVTGADAARAASLALKEPRLAVGIHLTVVGGGRPILDPAAVPSLVDHEGRLPGGFGAFTVRWFRGRIAKAELERELRAQLERAASLGIRLTHVDSHQHVHLLPGVFDLVLGLCREAKVPRLRVPRAGYRDALPFSIGWAGLEFFSRRAARRLAGAGAPWACEHFLGRHTSCRMTEAALLDWLRRTPAGTSELMVHPGFSDKKALEIYPWGGCWEQELEALKSAAARAAVEREGIELVAG
jgi:predicted glycoside hydrolase/deacetylase ChbG (UPF0249 family)